jgi:hypothetical protein
MPRRRVRNARFSLESLETRNLLSGVAPSGTFDVHYLVPNPPIISAGIQSTSDFTSTGGLPAASH